MVLADLGADVVKIEPIESGDETRNFPPFQGPLSHYYVALNHSKKSLALNLKSPRGLDIAKALAAQSDVVLENFRPGVMDRLGLGYETLSADNPSLVYCSITGFGADGPLADKPAFDIVAQALSGVMSVNGEPGAPPSKLGLPLGDMAGSIFAVFGILAALHGRQVSGRGQRVDIAMLDGLIAMLGYLAQIYFVTGAAPQPVGTRHPSIVPYGAFATKDGHVIVACLTERFWKNFAACLGMAELAEDPRFSPYQQRLANRAILEPMIETRMREDSTAVWLERLAQFDVPNAPILNVAEALQQAHVVARGLVETVTHPAAGILRLVRGPIRFDGQGPAPAQPPSLLGEDTATILAARLGYDEETVEQLAVEGIVGLPGMAS
ncbi:CaiB/BaiF family protein [Polymorphum gilvum SL003B-26A1]|uniref:CaiB/BaiF family protein n=2 Tax=Polymorphum TaxID=991903 RepID=F2IWY7_POLGS|nr:CaiB/BaiF family protein [Polymorphum gilvum SL003B-26A1]